MAVTTSEFVLVDGIPLNTWAWNITSGTGRVTTPEMRGEDIVLPGRSGSLFIPNKTLDVGTFSITMWVLGCLPDGSIPEGRSSRALFEENKDRLIRVFSTRHRLLHVEARRPDGTVRECWAQVLDSIDGQTVAGRTRGEFVVSFVIPDVYWRDPGAFAIEAYNFDFVDVVDKRLTYTIRPAIDMTGVVEDAVLEVTGPVTNPKVREETGGSEVQLMGTVLGPRMTQATVNVSSQVWMVDSGTWSSTLDGSTEYGPGLGSVVRRTVHRGSARFLSIPADPEFTFSFLEVQDAPSRDTIYFRLSFHQKYLMA